MTTPSPHDATVTERDVERARVIVDRINYWQGAVGWIDFAEKIIAQDRATARAEGVAEGRRKEREEVAELADGWPAECLAGDGETCCGPGIADAIKARGGRDGA